jgi:hypothetical protein
MRYWLTTHWPRFKDQPDSIPDGIYLADGRQSAGDDVASGDRVLIYQFKSGRSVLTIDTRGNERSRTRRRGAGGVIVVAEVTTRVEADPLSRPESYSDGTTIHWKWKAETRVLLRNGFVSKADINRIVFSENHPIRAIGKQKSGLKELSRDEFEAIVSAFTKNANGNPKLKSILEERKKRPPRNYFGPESDAHRQLKEYIAENASTALNEPGLTTFGVEYKFATNDRADVVLEDADGKIIGVEIEIEQGPEQLDGLLQAIKYRFMLAPFTERTYEQTRGFLIAYSLSDEIRDICEMYEIEHFTIDRHIVESWAAASCQ